jgi:hypothetical protein
VQRNAMRSAVPAALILTTVVSFLSGAVGCGGGSQDAISTPLPALPEPADGGAPDGPAWTEPPRDDATKAEEVCYVSARDGDEDTCADCCLDTRPRANELIWDTLRVCVCKKAKPSCVSACGTAYCSGTLHSGDASSECQTCLTDTIATGARDEDCLNAGSNGCEADAECAAIIRCTANCAKLAKGRAKDGGS